jgi:hypothetical protein
MTTENNSIVVDLSLSSISCINLQKKSTKVIQLEGSIDSHVHRLDQISCVGWKKYNFLIPLKKSQTLESGREHY